MRTKFFVALATTIAVSMFAASSVQALIDVEVEVQTHLSVLGYNPGGVDGVFGRGSRSALQRFERQAGLPADGRIDDQSRLALIDAVEEAQRQRFGRPLTGLWGTSRGCRSDANRMQVFGYTVSHKPIWSDKAFTYALAPSTEANKLTILWDSAGTQKGQSVEFDRRAQLLRVPELNMLGISPCTRYGVRDEVAFISSGTAGGASTTTPTTGSTEPRLSDASAAELFEALQRSMEADRSKVSTLERQVSDLTSTNQRLEGRVQSFADRANQNLRDQQQLRSQNSALESKNAALVAQVAELNRSVEQLRNRRGGNSRLRREIDELQTALDFANQRTQQLQSANQQLQTANQQLAAQLQQQGQPTTSTTTTLSGEDALRIIIPQLLNNLGN